MILQVSQAFPQVFSATDLLEVKTLPPEPAKEKEEPKAAEKTDEIVLATGSGRDR